MPTESDVHVDRPLTNFSMAAFQEESVHLASSCFPVIPVNNQTDKYYTWNRSDLFRDEARVRAPGTPVIRTGARLSSDSYYCSIYELGDIIPDEVRRNSDPGVNLEQNKVRAIIQKLLIKRERIFALNFLATSKWTTDIAGATVSPATNEVLQWANSSSTPVDDVLRGKERILKNTGKEANTLVLTNDVRRVLATNAQVLARLTGGQTPGGPAIVSDMDLAKVFEVNRILVSKAVYNSAAENATASMGFVATRKALLLYSDPNPGLDSETAGATFVWANSGFGNRVGVQINMMRDDKAYSDLIDGFMNFDQKLTSADMGYFFNNIISATA
jgi:hypothetical protein